MPSSTKLLLCDTIKKFSSPSTTLTTSLLFFFTITVASSIPLLTPLNCHAETKETETYDSVEQRRLENLLSQKTDSPSQALDIVVAKENELKILEQTVDNKLKQLDEQIAELKKIRDEIDAREKAIKELVVKKDKSEIKRIEALARIYEKMTPVLAARAIAGVDIRLASSIISTMKAKSAAKVLDALPQSVASSLTTKVSGVDTK